MSRIFYYCGAKAIATGGIKIIYRHVEILNDLGFDAYVMHPRADFRYDWFDHSPPVVSVLEAGLGGRDFLVLPEDGGPRLCAMARGIKKVMFNQNAYYSFRGFEDLGAPLPPYLDPEYVATLVVSDDNLRYLCYAFPGLKCHRIHLSLDFKKFDWVPPEGKSNQIAFMTRKNSADLIQVLQILRSRNTLGHWTLTPIEDQDEAGVARILGEARIFLAFGHPEGLSLSNLEAIARGCRVIGYSGLGGREFFADGRCLEVPVGDVIAFTEAIEAEMARFDQGCPQLISDLEAASSYVRRHYSPELERRDLQSFYATLMG